MDISLIKQKDADEVADLSESIRERYLKDQIILTEEKLIYFKNELNIKMKRNYDYRMELEELKRESQKLGIEVKKVEKERAYAKKKFKEISESRSWRFTFFVRKMLDFSKKPNM
ncbi:hypothetical protein JCM9140_2309 [Halalkalibacter wakoensis JCM 9140]|uniref:Uncharacterized protein n=1 Tax=Halalkalibacter wakoensis JCM 9140 TaxID=1236970 RepID=W4Q2F1_9BACI|nr:hypothetical protein [Halalkalibacter wakoensis]GAE26261.1 hypothetical protein JCM9140_2309 [Halalkalibacter wakoensis JCM 9140]